MTKEEARNLFAKTNQVIIRRLRIGKNSKCEKCKNDDRYSIFIGEYPRLSNLQYSSCAKHLPQFVDQAISLGKRQQNKQLKEWVEAEKQKAKQL